MPVGSGDLPVLHAIAGFKLGIASAGIKKVGRRDIVVMQIAAGSSVAAVFTQNAFCAAPVQLAKRHLAEGRPLLLVTNTGNANAGTGETGLKNALTTCEKLAQLAGVSPQSVLPFSTGVIGEPLPIDKIANALPAAMRSEEHTSELQSRENL